MVEQFISRFHILVVEERTEVQSEKLVVKERGDGAFGVGAAVVDENVAGWFDVGRFGLAYSLEDLALEVCDGC